MAFWKEFDLEKERRRQREKNNMDGFGYYTDEELNRFSVIHRIKPNKPINQNSDSPTQTSVKRTPLWQRIKQIFQQ